MVAYLLHAIGRDWKCGFEYKFVVRKGFGWILTLVPRLSIRYPRLGRKRNLWHTLSRDWMGRLARLDRPVSSMLVLEIPVLWSS